MSACFAEWSPNTFFTLGPLVQHTLKTVHCRTLKVYARLFFPPSNEKVWNLQEVLHGSANDLFSLKIPIAQLENH